MITPWLTSCYKSIDFFNIVGYPHDMPSSIDKLPIFHGDIAIIANDSWEVFTIFVCELEMQHLDVVLKLFVLSLKGKACKWFF